LYLPVAVCFRQNWLYRKNPEASIPYYYADESTTIFLFWGYDEIGSVECVPLRSARNSQKEIVMKFSRLRMTGLMGLLSLGLMLAGGCASSGGTRSQSAVASIAQVRQQIADGKTQVDTVLASMNAMQGSTDLAGAYEAFSDEVNKTQSMADDIKSSVADMNSRGQEYIQKWQEEMVNVTDPNLKASAEARRQAVAQRYSDVQVAYSAARDSYRVFYSDLMGIRTYLSNDRTPDGIAAAGSSMDQAIADGKTLKAKADAVIGQLDQITAGMPAAPAGN
jgi:hypothetical protein